MRKSLFAALLFILAFSGCAQTTMIENGQSAVDYYRGVNGQCEGKYCLLTLMDKEPFRVYNICVGVDSTSWTDLSSQKIKSVQTSNVYSVQVTDRAGGFLSGLAYGFLGGAAAGLAFGNLTDPQGHNGGPLLGLLGGALVGAVAGPIIGFTAGHQYYFIINEKNK